ncbi:HutD/Ves family protein [Longispora albida]|uniref:HutD/Ves family protein n=1 Tax=Longispora albida TaxID=203523 RepID=UPI00058CF18B|nr:HutD family protein [Longispora albida]
MKLLPAADRPATPWKNGGGVTREVASGPDGTGLDDFGWRVSLADVAASGPFSAFPGIDRVITVVDGPGMALTVDGVRTVISERYQPFAFPGEAVTGCELLGGPLVDFNVMTRRGQYEPAVEFVPGGPVAGPALIVVMDGYDAVLLDQGEEFTVDGAAAVVRITALAGDTQP